MRYGGSSDKIVLEIGMKGFTVIDLGKDPNYGLVKTAEAQGNLPDGKGNTSPRAAYFHKDTHMYEIVDYTDGTSEKRIKEDLIIAGPSDERCRLVLDLDQVDLAKMILSSVKAVFKEATTAPDSALSEEEILGPPPPPKERGGRGKKKVVKTIARIRPC